MFTIQPMHPETYRQQTRRIAMGLIVLFAGLAMLLSTLAVQLFGEPGGDNFRWNLAGVLLGRRLGPLRASVERELPSPAGCPAPSWRDSPRAWQAHALAVPSSQPAPKRQGRHGPD